MAEPQAVAKSGGKRPKPARHPGTPHATAVLVAELLPGTHCYTDVHRRQPPILVIDTGPCEIQLSLPGDRYTVEDLWVIDQAMEALVKFRTAALVYLG